jgi:4'-phosphopantetheinyl transferase
MSSVTVACNTITPACSSSFPTTLDSHSLHLFVVATTSHHNLLSHAEHILPDNELLRARSYHQLERREQFIISRCALRILLGAYCNQNFRSLPFATGVNKKPFLAGPEPVHFSVSHTRGCTLIGLALATIGVDIEQIDDAFQYQDISETCFSLQEQAHIAQSDNPSGAFYQLWTRKEALVKATSKGIDDDFKDIPCLDGLHTAEEKLLSTTTNWTTSSFSTAPTYGIAVSYQTSLPARKLTVCALDDLLPLLYK